MSELECGWARRALDLVFDGEAPPAGDRARLDAHLEACARCRGLKAELDEVQRRLRSMPPQRLPDVALEAVWAQTIRAPRARWSATWRAAAAAAVLVVALGGMVWLGTPGPSGPTDAEARRAAEETRLVLGLTAQAMRRTERLALHEVLGKDVSGALRRVPVDWPAAAGAAGVTDGSER